MITSITKPVSLGLIVLWAHERGEFFSETLAVDATVPLYSVVNSAGEKIDITVDDYDGSDAHGIKMGNDTVYYAHSIFNDKYIIWPDGIDVATKLLIKNQLKKSFLIIKEAA